MIIATNLSASADEALRQGHVLASARAHRLVACHVVDGAPDGHETVLRALTNRVVAIAGRTHDAFEAVVAFGAPTISIVELARQRHAELVVIGASEASRLEIRIAR